MSVRIETFETQEALEAKHGFMGAMGVCSGPIHQHDDQKFIQVYIGQHEWIAIRVDDPLDIRYDPGYIGKKFGFGIAIFSDGDRWWRLADSKKLLKEPVSDLPPITMDELLFADKDKVEKYLGKKLEDIES